VDKVKAEIEELLYENAEDLKIAKVLKKEIKSYFDTLEDTFSTSGGKDFLVKHTKKIDSILQLIFKVAQREMFGDYTPMKNSIPLAMVALGSYGREQLCVHSDIDLMLVYKDIPGYNLQEMIEKINLIARDNSLHHNLRVNAWQIAQEYTSVQTTGKLINLYHSLSRSCLSCLARRSCNTQKK